MFVLKEHIFRPNECPIRLGWLGKVGFGLDLLKLFVSISFPFLSYRSLKKMGAVYQSIHVSTNATFGSVRNAVFNSGTPFASYLAFFPLNKTIYSFNKPNMVTKIAPVFAKILR